MVSERQEGIERKKPAPHTTREINTMTYLLRCKQMGLSLEELDCLNYGMVWDMLTEEANDHCEYAIVAGQKEFHEFIGG